MPATRSIDFNIKVNVDNIVLSELTNRHQKVVKEAISILNSKALEELCSAYINEESLTKEHNGRHIAFENDPPCTGTYFGMSLFEANKFVLMCMAFSSKEELIKTVLVELYRLHYSKLRGKLGKIGAVAKETKEAYDFSSYIYNYIFKK